MTLCVNREEANMAKTSESRVITVLNAHADALCQHTYVELNRVSPRRCLLGWLAWEASIPLPPSRVYTHAIGMRGTKRFANAIQREYSLTLRQLKGLQAANDDSPNSSALDKRVAEVLKSPDNHNDVAA